MVRHTPGLPTLTLSVLLSTLALPAATNNLNYKIGDKAEEDIVAPVRLVVIDPEATDALKERESQRVPVIYRFYPRAIDEVESAFHSTFATTRSNFLRAVEANFQQRQLEEPEITSTNFQSFVASFQRQNILFPVNTELATLWARNESDEPVASALTARLRETMQAYIRSDTSPQDIWVGSTLRLVSLADNEKTTARLVEERGNNI